MHYLFSKRAVWAGTVMLALCGASPSFAATYIVSSTADSGAGTLRAALLLATSGSDTINFSGLTLPATITLSSDELHLNSPVTITGPGASSLTISGGGKFRVFEADSVSVTISGLTITGGSGTGSTAYPGLGGAIYNGLGTMALTGVTLSSNSAVEGGALYNNGPMTITNCTISGNTATTGTFTGEGGAIYNYGTLTVSGSTISSNQALDTGTSTSASSGGILNAYIGLNTTGVLVITNSSIIGNSAHFEAGGIENNAGTMTITNSTVSGNQAGGQGGGIENFGVGTISGSTISGNTSGGASGGIDNQNSLTITNSTISGNSAGTSGGGIYSGGTSGVLNLSFVTLSGNRSNTFGLSFVGDNLANYGTASLKNTILANSSGAGGNCYVIATYPAITSQGYNLSDDSTCTAYFNQSSDQNNTSAGLNSAGRSSNGGNTQTIALLSGSHAEDAIPVSPFNYCTDLNGNPVTVDQRGVARPQGVACDIGSFELVQLTSQTISFLPLTNQLFGAAPFTVSATATSGLQVTFNSQTTSVCTATGANGATITLLTTGTCTIQATQAGNASYAAATPVSQSFQVTGTSLMSQTITFSPLANQPISAKTFAVSAPASSSLQVTFNSQTSTICTVSGTTVTLVAIGTCTIQATQAGNATYAAAAPVTQSFQVTLVTQTITFGPLPNRLLSTATFTVAATASSGLTVTFASATSGTCSVLGTTVTLVSAGLCTIQAAQAGNSTYYAPATPVNQSFEIELTALTYGTACRVTQQDQFPSDFEDFTTGTANSTRSSFASYTTVAIQGCYPQITAPGPANPPGMSVGAWSESATAQGSARAVAYRNFVNQTNSSITLKLNAVLNGVFQPSPFQLPTALAYVAAAIHVYDTTVFQTKMMASGKTPGQFLLDGYSASTALNPATAIGTLSSLFPGGVIMNGPIYQAVNAPNDNTTISANVSSGMFTVGPNGMVTVVFDAATSALIVQTGDTLTGGKIGGATAYFLDTLEPAANFFSDANGNPIPGLTPLDTIPPASLPPVPASVTLAAPAGSDLVGITASITATATDTNGNPLAGAIVKFTVTSGPNAGTTGGGVTDANGHFKFSYGKSSICLIVKKATRRTSPTEMALEFTTSYLRDSLALLRYYKNLAERAMAQAPEEQLTATLCQEMNSIATVVKHLAGNMRSRWTDFLTSNGEKPDCNRDTEFEAPPQTRADLFAMWDAGWACLFGALEPPTEADLQGSITIRGEAHSVM